MKMDLLVQFRILPTVIRVSPKERVEIYANGSTAVLDDFKTLAIHAHGKKKEKKLFSQDKGQLN